MKGVVFTEFLEMVEETFSIETADRIIEASDLSTDGAYTAVGTYDYEELAQLVTHLSRETDTPVAELLRAFGRRLFGSFHRLYPGFFEGIASAFDFLQRVESYIHVEVMKLYGDAELPTFAYEMRSPDELVVEYRSTRPLADLAEGLIEGCIAHFAEGVRIDRSDHTDDGETRVRFVLSRGE